MAKRNQSTLPRSTPRKPKTVTCQDVNAPNFHGHPVVIQINQEMEQTGKLPWNGKPVDPEKIKCRAAEIGGRHCTCGGPYCLGNEFGH